MTELLTATKYWKINSPPPNRKADICTDAGVGFFLILERHAFALFFKIN